MSSYTILNPFANATPQPSTSEKVRRMAPHTDQASIDMRHLMKMEDLVDEEKTREYRESLVLMREGSNVPPENIQRCPKTKEEQFCVELPDDLKLTKMEIISLAQSGFYVRKTSSTVKVPYFPFFEITSAKSILTTKIL